MAARRDRISQLPTDILDHILRFLPIQDAAKTAILSTIWKDLWLGLTQLKFDYEFFCYLGKKHRRASKYVRKSGAALYVINKVLLQHNGTIQKFVLNLYDVGILTIRSRSYDFDQWLLLVTRKGVEEMHIRFWHNVYKLPNCIFSCLTLKRLHLYGVVVEPMKFPSILPNVASLCFEQVYFGPINLLDCAINVPVLENLSFLRCQNMFYFDITAPKLCSFTIKHCSSDVLGKFLPINLDLRSISTLDLNGLLQVFLKEFTRMGFQLNVEYLKLSWYHHESDVTTSALVHLLRLFPKLCKLDIDLFELEAMATNYKDGFSKFLSKLHAAHQTNKMLYALKLISFRGTESEILFIKELLASLSALEKVVIVHNRIYHCNLTIMQEILYFPRASRKAEIIFV